MKLYVCWGAFPVPWPRKGAPWRPDSHPCKRAFDALVEAGYEPQVAKTYSFGSLPPLTSGRREVKRLTDQKRVPVLVLDDGQVLKESQNIVDWAAEHPAVG